MEADLADIAGLGVRVVRYGTPWRLAEPERGVYDWSLWDRAFAACAAAGLEPIVEFLHFGLPDHYPGFVDGRLGRRLHPRTSRRSSARYPTPRWFTPINEPGITARLSARFGIWNDMAATPEAHAQALANIVLANLEAIDRIRSDRGGWWIGSEGFDIPVAITPDREHDEVETRRALGWLVWDLHLGVEPLPAAADYLESVDDAQLDRIRSLAVQDRLVAGLDIYPISVMNVGGDRPAWTVEELIGLSVQEIERWHDRYAQPFWIAETSNLTLPLDQQIAWLDAFADGLARLRTDGRPARGLCWYSRGDQFDWQTASDESGRSRDAGRTVRQRRNARPVAARFAELAV